jgi:hypothetical protein
MTPIDEASDRARRIFVDTVQRGTPALVPWSVEDVLIVDNWRTVHGRTEAHGGSTDRKLLRLYVEELS